MAPKRIGFIGFDGVGTMDMTSAAAAFNCAEIRDRDRGPKQCYEIVIIGLSNKPFVATSGIVFKPHKTFKNAPPLDTLIIPGGKRSLCLDRKSANQSLHSSKREPDAPAALSPFAQGSMAWL